jgi:hypothetical protein
MDKHAEAISKAEATGSELVTRLAAAREALAANISRRADLAFASETGDTAARKMTAAFAKEAAALTDDIASLEAATAEAGRRVAAARAADLDATERAKAEKALAMIEAFRKRGATLDAAFDAAIAEFAALERDFKALDLLGYAPSTWALVKINLQLAAGTKLQLVGLQQNFLAPRERRNFLSAISGWADNVARRARARMERGTRKDAA